jgi:hypothetical protein
MKGPNVRENQIPYGMDRKNTAAALAIIAVLASVIGVRAQAPAAASAVMVASAKPTANAAADIPTKRTTKPDLDPLLAAMQDELEREKTDLVLPGMQRPYFIAYRLEDIQSYDATASYGALTGESERRQRIVRVEVRARRWHPRTRSRRR